MSVPRARRGCAWISGARNRGARWHTSHETRDTRSDCTPHGTQAGTRLWTRLRSHVSVTLCHIVTPRGSRSRRVTTTVLYTSLPLWGAFPHTRQTTIGAARSHTHATPSLARSSETDSDIYRTWRTHTCACSHPLRTRRGRGQRHATGPLAAAAPCPAPKV